MPVECLRLPLHLRMALCDELLLVDVRVLLRLGLGRAPPELRLHLRHLLVQLRQLGLSQANPYVRLCQRTS